MGLLFTYERKRAMSKVTLTAGIVETSTELDYDTRLATNYVRKILRTRGVDTSLYSLLDDIVQEGAKYFYAAKSRQGLPYHRKGETRIVRSLSTRSAVRFGLRNMLKRQFRKTKRIQEGTTVDQYGNTVPLYHLASDTLSVASYRASKRSFKIVIDDEAIASVERLLGVKYVELVKLLQRNYSQTQIATKLEVSQPMVCKMIAKLRTAFTTN